MNDRLAELLERLQWPLLSYFQHNMNSVMTTVYSYLGDPKSVSWNELLNFSTKITNVKRKYPEMNMVSADHLLEF